MSVLYLDKKELWEYQIVPPTRYQKIYNDDQKTRLANLYAEYAGGQGYDGDIVCLEGISSIQGSKKTVYLSIASFYDFLLANIIGRETADPHNKFIRYLGAGGVEQDIIDLATELGMRYIEAKARIETFDDFLDDHAFPNAIAVSILVHDSEDHFLLSRRTDNVIIGKRYFGVTASGSVEPGDLAKMPVNGKPGIDPFSAGAARELAEEAGLGVPDRNMTFEGFVAGREKLQPIAIVNALYPRTFADDFKLYNPIGDDPDSEVFKLVSLPKSELPRIPAKYQMTEAAEFHILSQCKD